MQRWPVGIKHFPAFFIARCVTVGQVMLNVIVESHVFPKAVFDRLGKMVVAAGHVFGEHRKCRVGAVFKVTVYFNVTRICKVIVILFCTVGVARALAVERAAILQAFRAMVTILYGAIEECPEDECAVSAESFFVMFAYARVEKIPRHLTAGRLNGTWHGRPRLSWPGREDMPAMWMAFGKG